MTGQNPTPKIENCWPKNMCFSCHCSLINVIAALVAQNKKHAAGYRESHFLFVEFQITLVNLIMKYSFIQKRKTQYGFYVGSSHEVNR